MTYPSREYPYLTHRHLEETKIYPSRYDLIFSLSHMKNPIIAEVGVAKGEFSKTIIDALNPKEFVAIDMFKIHEWEMLWGEATSKQLEGLTHREFYEREMSKYKDIIRIEEGASYDCLDRFPDNYFDLIYVDADHEYHNVIKDAMVSVNKVKPGGIVIFNDYMMYDHISEIPYGVVQAANEVIVRNDMKVIGFALGWNMYCDLAAQKRGDANSLGRRILANIGLYPK